MKINALASPDARRLDDDRQREALAAGSFDDELDAARNKPDELKPDDTDGRARDAHCRTRNETRGVSTSGPTAPSGRAGRDIVLAPAADTPHAEFGGEGP